MKTSLDLASTNQPVIVTNNGGTVDVFSSTLSLSGTSTVIVSSGPLNIAAPVTLDAATVSLLQAGSITVNSTPPATDYAVSIVNGVLTLTDLMGHGDTLAIDESGINEIAFSAPGRTFSPAGPYSLDGITHIVVLAAGGDDIINVGDFPQTILPSLTIKGGRGNDTVNINGSLTFGDEASLTIDLQSDDASPGVDQIIVAQDAEISLPEDSTGSVTLRTSRNVSLAPGSAIIGGLGEVVIEANQQATPTSGDFVGIAAQGATISTSGGNVSLTGRGGNTNEATANTPNVGVNLSHAEVHVAGTGTVTFSGSSEEATGVVFANSALTAEQGNVTFAGSGIEFTGNRGSESVRRWQWHALLRHQ